MKSNYLPLLLLFTALLGGCRKEELPPVKCNPIVLRFYPYGPSNLDSMSVRLMRNDVKNRETLDTMLYDPISGTFTAHFDFCGPFSYTIQAYNSSVSGPYCFFEMWVNNELEASGTLSDNETFANDYVYRLPL